MKIIKLSTLKNQKSLSKSSSLVKLKVNTKKNENVVEFGNLIRQKILKETLGLKITLIRNERIKQKIKILTLNK